MLRVKRDSWHYRLYRWWQHTVRVGASEAWGYRYATGASQENLCHYMRVIFFWAPLRWLFQARFGPNQWPVSMIWAPALLLIALIVGLILDPGFVLTVILTIVGIAVLAVLGLGVAWSIDKYREEPEAFTTARAVVTWTRARKRRICPLIEFDGDNEISDYDRSVLL